MLFLPQTEEQLLVVPRQLIAAMHTHMAAPTERNLQGGFVRSRPAVMHHQTVERQTDLAAAIPDEHPFAVAAEEGVRAAAPIVTTPAPAAGEDGTTAARPAAPGGLGHAPSSLPRGRTWIRCSGTPASTAARKSSPASQAESSAPATPTQRPVPSSSRSAEARRSPSSGRCRWCNAAMTVARTASVGVTARGEEAKRGIA